MLCSLPAGKAGPNWLDRLRSNKGFPIAHNLDLDHFLTNQNLHNPPDPTPPNPNSHPRNNSSTNSPAENGNPNPNPYGIITGILSDLFHMTAASQNSRKKFPRKQSTPKICSTPSLNKQHNILSSNSDNASKPSANKSQNARAKVEDDDVEDEIKADKELLGYSKSEVTVIDTSCDVWKSDKLIFRKKNVWKVKDKKAKSRSYGRKKRKQSAETNDLPDMTASATKKTKVWGSEERFHFNAQRKESLKPLNKGFNAQLCSGPEMSANLPDSSNGKKENVYTLLQENGSYDPEKSDQPRA